MISLNEGSQAVSDSIFGENGALTYLYLYEYAVGKLRARRSGPQTAHFFHAGDNLDSVAVTRNDTMVENYKYAYGSQNRPVRMDHL